VTSHLNFDMLLRILSKYCVLKIPMVIGSNNTNLFTAVVKMFQFFQCVINIIKIIDYSYETKDFSKPFSETFVLRLERKAH
jgi:hypothetical protein